MTPYAIETGDITESHLKALAVARRLLAELPDGLDCHEVCQVLAPLTDARHVRGRFNHCEHSWLEFPGAARVILDPYPWAGASGPLLIVGSAMMWRSLYEEDEENGSCVHSRARAVIAKAKGE